MNLKIAVLAGDGIGPEISQQGVAVMSAVCNKLMQLIKLVTHFLKKLLKSAQNLTQYFFPL